MKISFLYENAIRFNSNVKRFIGKTPYISIYAWGTEIYCFLKFGCSPDDFFRYEFYKKSNYERRRFITYRKSQYIIKKYNSPKYREILDDKAKFNSFFSEYIHREWIDLRNASKEEFEAFLRKHNNIIVKPLKGGQGIGITKLTYDGYKEKDYEKYRDYIAEEVIHQAKELEILNTSSVNTIRVLTFKGKAIAAAIRIGAGNSIVDNLHSNGICGHIDLDKGLIDAPCINNKYDKFIYHPASKYKLIGFEIPNWEEVLKVVERASLKVSNVKYIGWDVAVLENNEVELIEGNYDPGHDVVQMIVQSGLWGKIVHM